MRISSPKNICVCCLKVAGGESASVALLRKKGKKQSTYTGEAKLLILLEIVTVVIIVFEAYNALHSA